MVNAYFLVNDPPVEGPAFTFAAALEILPREGEVISFDESGPLYKVLLVQHHVRGAMRVPPDVSGASPAQTGTASPEDEDVPTVAHEISVMIRRVTDDEYDRSLRLNRARAAARLAAFLSDSV